MIGSRSRRPNVTRTHLLGWLLLPGLLLTGCLVGPDHRPPAPLGTQPLPSRFDAATNGVTWVPARSSAPAGDALPLPQDWWRGFQDPEADRLIDLAMQANPTLAVAAAQVARARAEAGIVGSARWPTARLSGTYTRQRGSANAFNPGNAAGVGRTYSLTTIPLEATWEPDLWGRVRRLRERAEATVQVSEREAAGVRLALQAEVASQLLLWRSLGIQSRILTETTQSLGRALDLTRLRRQGGLGTELEVNQATALLASTSAQLPGIRLQRLRLEHALATLCGRPANGFTLTDTTPAWPTPNPPEFPETLPSELLERRPDIAAAERRVAAANAAIGLAHAAFYPRFHLSVMGGLQSLHGSDVFTAPSRMWSLGPGVELPLFTGGRLRGQLASARAEHEGSAAAYRETVLNALQEVEDGLAAHRELAAQAELEQQALAAARRSRELAENRYRSGLVSYLEVVTAQTLALERELAVVRLEGERRLNAVALARALGGGWQAPSGRDTPP
jgi:multidrug efflux system outer membrane protein